MLPLAFDPEPEKRAGREPFPGQPTCEGIASRRVNFVRP
jgi:hypothetical protein